MTCPKSDKGESRRGKGETTTPLERVQAVQITMEVDAAGLVKTREG